MNVPRGNPGGAAIGRLADLPPLEREVIRCLRLWCIGSEGHRQLEHELGRRLGQEPASRILEDFAELVSTTVRHARRPLLGHAVDCPCAGSDECVFARFVALAAEGAREDAVLIAALMVRADLALGLASLAEQTGLGLMRTRTLRVVQ